MDDERRPARASQEHRTWEEPKASPRPDLPPPRPPELAEPAGEVPDDEVVPDGRYEPL